VQERHIPIFLFSIAYRTPLFIDKYYQARALKDMVIIVQSPHLQWASRMQCNGKSIYLNLRYVEVVSVHTTVVLNVCMPSTETH